MKHWKHFLFSACVLCLLCSLAGCKDAGSSQPVSLLEAEALTEALETAGLAGTISESESQPSMQTRGQTKYVHYVVRGESEQPDNPEKGLPLIADITSADYKGKPMLYTTFSQHKTSEFLAWEDWKQQIVFAALLYGGFENEESVYQAFLDKEFPDGSTVLVQEVQLPEGYCRASFSSHSSKHYDENGFEVREYTGFLRVQIFESYEMYQDLQASQKNSTAG